MTANGVGTCGPDDNQAQAGHLIVTALTTRAGCTFDDQQTGQGDQSHTLTSEGADASEDGTGRGTPVVAFHMTQDPISGDIAPAMGAGNGRGCSTIAVALRGRDGGATAELGDDQAFALRASQGGGDKPHVIDGVIVRRLTPLECERLQGLPDGWTDVAGASDSQRYRQLGNSVAVPVFEWVLRRLVTVDGGSSGV